jgi:hypothetical protein
VRVRKELRQRLVDKYWDAIELLLARMLPTNPKDKKAWSRMLSNGPAKTAVTALEAYLKRVPDDRFEAVMALIDSMGPFELMRIGFKTGLSQLPKKRGGRPAAFSLEVRRKAVQDIGNEYPRYDTLSEAIDVVAARHGMTAEYLHKVWKNRKRLRQREV